MKRTRSIAGLIGLTLGLTMVPALTTPTAAAVDFCRLPGGVLSVGDLAGRSAVACGAVGRLIDVGDGAPMRIPAPGNGVILGLSGPDGARTYTLSTDSHGLVSVGIGNQVIGHQPTAAGPSPLTRGEEFPDLPGPSACERDSFVLAGFKWHKPYLFRTTVGTALATEDQRDFDAAARRSVRKFTRAYNDCGLRVPLGAAGAFIGHTFTHGNFITVGDQVTCDAPDNENVLDEGDMPGGFLEAVLAAFCVWTQTDNGVTRAVSADLRFNDGDYNWTYDPSNDPLCDRALPPDPDRWRYDVESTIMHELGHVYGLVNLSSIDDANLTMFPGVSRCTGHFRTLGLGDVLGLQALYGVPAR